MRLLRHVMVLLGALALVVPALVFGPSASAIPPPASIQASLTNDWVAGQMFGSNASISIWVDTDPNADPPTATAMTDGGGEFFADQIGVNLMPGMNITVRDSVSEEELLLEGPLSIMADPATGAASGQLPDSASVRVDIGGPSCGTGLDFTDNGPRDLDGTTGLFAVDLSGELAADCPGGLGPNPGGQISLPDADNDATVAEPTQPPSVQASVDNDWVAGDHFLPNTTIDIWIDADPVADPPTLTLVTDGDGNFGGGSGTDLVVGTTVIVSDGASTKELVLEGPLSIMADPAAGTASGQLPDSASVRVDIGGPSCGTGLDFTDNGPRDLDGTTGLFAVDLSGELAADCPGGLGPNPGGQISLPDADNDATVAEPTQPPSVQASVDNDWVAGDHFLPNTTIDIWIDADPVADPPTLTLVTDGDGNFGGGSGTDLVVGTTVIVSDGASTKELVLEGPLSIMADPAAGTASGQLPALRNARVDLGGPSCGTGLDFTDNGPRDLDGTTGLFAVDLSGELAADCPGGLGPNPGGQISLPDADNDRTVAEPPPPAAILASLANFWVGGQSLAPNANVQIWIDTPMTVSPTATAMTDSAGNFFNDQIGIDLVPGTTIMVSDGVSLRTLVLEGPLSIIIDPAAATASGVLPAGSEAQVEMGGQECGAGTDGFLADDGQHDLDPVAGQWAADLSEQCPGGFGAGDYGGQIVLFDDDGDQTIAEDGGFFEPPPEAPAYYPPRQEEEPAAADAAAATGTTAAAAPTSVPQAAVSVPATATATAITEPLAHTGSDNDLFNVSLLLIASGAGLIALGRQRRRSTED